MVIMVIWPINGSIRNSQAEDLYHDNRHYFQVLNAWKPFIDLGLEMHMI
jgi:hypothetical protein